VLAHNANTECQKKGTGGLGYRTNDVGPHRELSKGSNRAPGHSPNNADGRIQSNHPIQQDWAKRNVANYNPDDAPTILLPTGRGRLHTAINNLQKGSMNGNGNSLRNEFERGYAHMVNAGVNRRAAQKAIRKNYKYFSDLGASFN
jgi:hypothetical protein